MFLTALVGQADPITVGTILFANPLATEQGFQITNNTGQIDGCDAPDGIPVCTDLAFENTSLVVTLGDGSTITRTPSGGFSFGPGNYIYGDNVGDDLSNSFLFDNSLNIISATFSGDVSPASFSITDSNSAGNLSTFFSGGSFSVTLDLSTAPPLAGDPITLDLASTIATPEPASGSLVLLLLFASFIARLRILLASPKLTSPKG